MSEDRGSRFNQIEIKDLIGESGSEECLSNPTTAKLRFVQGGFIEPNFDGLIWIGSKILDGINSIVS